MATLQEDGRIALAAGHGRTARAFGLGPWPARLGRRGRAPTQQRHRPGGRSGSGRLATFVGYVQPDAAGEIELPSGSKYAVVAGPTRWLYVRVVFNTRGARGRRNHPGTGHHLRRSPVGGLPAGQRYFTPAQIAQPGRLYTLERVPAFTRNGAVRQTFEYVLPF